MDAGAGAVYGRRLLCRGRVHLRHGRRHPRQGAEPELPHGDGRAVRHERHSRGFCLPRDIAGYIAGRGADALAGRAFGKRKLCPAVSPNKTVAGCIGGFVGSIAGMAVFHLVVKTWFQLDLGWGVVILMGVIGSLFGQLGDLSFSVIKREFGIKDYGAIFPGHGGVLDRFDSVLFVAPAYLLFMLLYFA